MTYKHVFEAVDRILRDFMKTIDLLLKEKLFGGKVIVFCQILPVVIKRSREDIVESCLWKSTLWIYVKLLTLKINMHLFHAEN